MRISDWSSDVCSSDLLHQRCGVKIGRDRRRRGHRVRQPEMEWKLCAFGEGADQDQYERRKIGGVILDGRSSREHDIDVIASCRAPEDRKSTRLNSSP